MTNDRASRAGAAAPKSELTEAQLTIVSGGALNVVHNVVSPRDAASGLATGKRMHKAF
ncbi:MAG: hypothetical protein ACREEG_13825 [Phenylobacterium sp.]